MKGKFKFAVSGKRSSYTFSINRNITIIKGNSGTGKTTLLQMMYEYLLTGKQSGYKVSTNASNYFVYIRDSVGRTWKDELSNLEDTVIFIEENNDFIYSKEFAKFVQESGNYFVLVTRRAIKTLPYSIQEIYEITADSATGVYHKFGRLYSNFSEFRRHIFDTVITEDSKSGHQFYSKFYANKNVVTSYGNAKMINTVLNSQSKNLLVIADGAAFGSLVEDFISMFNNENSKCIVLWAPESFEYLVLKSGIITNSTLTNIFENTSDYIDSKVYVSWERYFTDLLIDITKGTYYAYSKDSLNTYYLRNQVLKKIAKIIPNELQIDTGYSIEDMEAF